MFQIPVTKRKTRYQVLDVNEGIQIMELCRHEYPDVESTEYREKQKGRIYVDE